MLSSAVGRSREGASPMPQTRNDDRVARAAGESPHRTVDSPGVARRAEPPPLPPGSRLPSALQTALWLRDPVGVLVRYGRRYGDIFRIGVVGVPGFVYVVDPALANRVFVTDRDIGRAGEAREGFLEPLVGSHSLLTLDGEEWMRQRKLLGSAFHGKRIERYRDEIAAIAADHVRRWPVGEPFALRPRMQAITLEVILRVVFGLRDVERVERLRELLPRLTGAGESVNALAFLVPPPIWTRIEALLARVPGTPMARFAALRKATDELLYAEISRRRTDPDLADRIDILSVLLGARDENGHGMTDAELRDALMTLLVAGHETTATALSWAFERLVRHPRVTERLRGSLAEGDEGYLDAVVKETLRTRPIVPDMPRVLTEPLDLDGYRVPAGWWVSPSPLLLHRSADEFPEPKEFRPERFLTEDAPSQAWIPFGGGRRQCLGSHFALLEMRAVIPEVLGRLRLRVADDPAPEAPRVRNVTLAPVHDARVIAKPA
ncbi:MAG: cytochrome P450 [Streptosporangiales bacterium]|nr:cytochrome P450 [Streptosporangiales bacterium]